MSRDLPNAETHMSQTKMTQTEMTQAEIMQPEIKTFADFWPHYLAEHSRAGTRLLHAAGTIASTTLAVALVATGRWRWLPLALVVGYAAGACNYYGPTEILLEGYRTHYVSYEQNGWCYGGEMYPL